MAMLVLNVSCSVCKAKFNKTDSIYSTSCGHVFHFTCMNEWQCRSTSCPLCRTYNPQNFRIYLNFGDGDEHNVEVKLKADEEKIKEMQKEIDKKDKKIDKIKKLYNISEQWRAKLQDKIQLLPLEYQAEKEELSKTLQLKCEEIENLKLNPESMKISKEDKKLDHVAFENSNLKEKLLTCEYQNIDLNQKIKMLELKLKLVTEELRLNIKENVDLTIPNAGKGQLSSTKHVNKSKAVVFETGHKKKNKMNNLNKTLTNSIDEEKSDYKICIRDFPKKEVIATLTLKANIVILASKMFLSLSESDIAEVHTSGQNHGHKSNYITLTVTFESIEKKKVFFSNRNLLKLNPSTMSIRIKEYINSDVYAVFKYANYNLRSKGIFNFIYCKDNQVIAKKNFNDTNEVSIKSKSDVDKLLTEHNRII